MSQELLTQEQILEAVRTKIASEVLKSLNDEIKEQILTKALVHIMDGWEFKRELKEVIMDIAFQEIYEYLQQPEVRQKIREQAIMTVGKFIAALERSLVPALLNLFGGDLDWRKPKITQEIEKCLKEMEKRD